MTERRASPDSGSNRLAGEHSPYLLQHAHNPVDWWPWCAEAIAEARRRDVPLFISIGYSTCHWCHVMARESFEHAAIGRLLGEHFVCVKVDREERPDVDEVCMTACQVFTQLVEGRASGGWPLSIWLEPVALHPFFVGTYFPPEPAHGRPSFAQVIEALATAWRDRRREVKEQASRLVSMVITQLTPSDESMELPESIVRESAARLMSIHDRTHGGFGSAPKFPQPVYLELLLALGAEGDTAMLEAVRRSLQSMARGGVFDQAGGGFHRYAVDEAWVVPHFEKMLYDNGQLASLYARAGRHFGDERLIDVARRIGDFVLREMRAPEGGFFCAIDAEANGREGDGYVWTRESFERALIDAGLRDDLEWALGAFGVDAGPNFREPHHPESAPASVLLDRTPWIEAQRSSSVTRMASNAPVEDAARMDRVRAALLRARAAFGRPATDDKVIPSWNGFMIEGLAETARSMPGTSDATRFLEAGRSAARFVLASMRQDDGTLLRTWRAGTAAVPAALEDYGVLACGLLALAAAESNADSARRTWIDAAHSLLDTAEQRFADGRGGWFDAPPDGLLFARARSLDDGAVPSGTTAMCEALLRLASIDDRDAAAAKALDRVVTAVRAASASLVLNPLASTGLLRVIHRVRRLRPGAI